jgi:predicted nucleic acid-binding Zn ribbon protein
MAKKKSTLSERQRRQIRIRQIAFTLVAVMIIIVMVAGMILQN